MKVIYRMVSVALLLGAMACGSTTAEVPPTPTVVETSPTAPATPTTVPTEPPAATATPSEAPTEPPAQTPSPAATAPAMVRGETRTDLSGTLLFMRGSDLWQYTPRDGDVRLLIRDAREGRWSPDGSQIAFVRDDGLYIANADGGDERRASDTNAVDPVWAPDGTKLAFELGIDVEPATPREVWVYDLATSEARKIADGADPAWAPDSQRIAYVTVAGDDPPRRNELRIANWRGENGWTVVRDLPEGTPPIGIPDSMVEPSGLEHIMQDPFWGPTGQSLYAPSFVLYSVLVGFSIWERADTERGGSTFLGELPEVMDATPAPNRQAVLFSVSSARGDTWFVARGVETEDSAWTWAETSNGAVAQSPAWASDNVAVAYFGCSLDTPERCDLRVRVPDGEATVIEDVWGGGAPDPIRPPTIDWTAGE
jgi:dipeptidyl aminopeptidase/acylaminoacyl peptidase